MPLSELEEPVFGLMLPVDGELMPDDMLPGAMLPGAMRPVLAPALVLGVAVEEPVPGVAVMLPVEPMPVVPRMVLDGVEGALSAALVLGLEVPALAPLEPLESPPLCAYVRPTPPITAAASREEIRDLVGFNCDAPGMMRM